MLIHDPNSTNRKCGKVFINCDPQSTYFGQLIFCASSDDDEGALLNITFTDMMLCMIESPEWFQPWAACPGKPKQQIYPAGMPYTIDYISEFSIVDVFSGYVRYHVTTDGLRSVGFDVNDRRRSHYDTIKKITRTTTPLIDDVVMIVLSYFVIE